MTKNFCCRPYRLYLRDATNQRLPVYEIFYEVRRGRLMGRGIPSELADTTKPGCNLQILYIAMIVKTFLNFVESHKCSNRPSIQLKI